MLMVVFGAGASHGCLMPPADTPHGFVPPPLTDNLFDTAYDQVLARFPDCLPIVNHLRQFSPSSTFEETMARLTGEGETRPERRKHLAATRFYLQELLTQCGQKTALHSVGADAYMALLDNIETWRYPRNESVLLVTFNYDTLLENAISSFSNRRFRDMDDYVSSHDYKVFKLHGSADWGHPVFYKRARLETRGDIIHNSMDPQFTIHASFLHGETTPLDTLYPALALPVRSKMEFECPSGHLEELGRLMPQIDRVLIVGWRAAELHFLNMWRQLAPAIKTLGVMCGSPDEGASTNRALGTAGIAISKVAELHPRFNKGLSQIGAVLEG